MVAPPGKPYASTWTPTTWAKWLHCSAPEVSPLCRSATRSANAPSDVGWPEPEGRVCDERPQRPQAGHMVFRCRCPPVTVSASRYSDESSATKRKALTAEQELLAHVAGGTHVDPARLTVPGGQVLGVAPGPGASHHSHRFQASSEQVRPLASALSSSKASAPLTCKLPWPR